MLTLHRTSVVVFEMRACIRFADWRRTEKQNEMKNEAYHQNPKIVENVRVTDKEIFESVDIFGVNEFCDVFGAYFKWTIHFQFGLYSYVLR